MSVYRNDLDAAVRRANALEAELRSLRARRREDRAELRVKIAELTEDLEQERERIRDLEAALRSLGPSGVAFELMDRLGHSQRRLHELDTAIRELHPTLRGGWRPKGAVMAALVSSAALLAVGVGLTLHEASSRAGVQGATNPGVEAEGLAAESYSAARRAIAAYEELLRAAPAERDLLVAAARLRSRTALEYGTSDDVEALRLARRAEAAGAERAALVPVRTAVCLRRWDLECADRELNESPQGAAADLNELILLRGEWYLRRARPREALRRFNAVAASSPRPLRALLGEARAYLQLGDVVAARSALDEIDRRWPDNVAARLLRAELLIERMGAAERGEMVALQVLDELAGRAAPTQRAEAYALRARANLDLGHRQRARELALRARLGRRSYDAPLAARLARVFLELGDVSDGLEQARMASNIAPHREEYRRLLAEAYAANGELERGAATLDGARSDPRSALVLGRIELRRGRLTQAEQHLSRALHDELTSDEARLGLARVALERGAVEQAEALLSPAAARLAESPGFWALRSEIHRRALREREALIAAERALALDPDHPAALVALGELYLLAGRWIAAYETFERALDHDAAATRASIGRVRAEIGAGHLEPAQGDLDRLASVAPSGWIALVRGELLLARRDPEGALPWLERARAAMPGSALAAVLVADALRQLRDGQTSGRRVVEAYRRALELAPGEPRALVGLAEVEISRTGSARDMRRALDDASRSLVGHERPARLRARLEALRGEVAYELRGDTRTALASLERALTLHPDVPLAHLLLGYLYEDLGQRSDACEHLRLFLELSPPVESLERRDVRRIVGGCPTE